MRRRAAAILHDMMLAPARDARAAPARGCRMTHRAARLLHAISLSFILACQRHVPRPLPLPGGFLTKSDAQPLSGAISSPMISSSNRPVPPSLRCLPASLLPATSFLGDAEREAFSIFISLFAAYFPAVPRQARRDFLNAALFLHLLLDIGWRRKSFLASAFLLSMMFHHSPTAPPLLSYCHF